MFASLIAAFVSGETFLALRQGARTALAYGVAGSLAICGAGFLLVALYIAVARRLGPVQAAVVFGVVFILAAAVVVLGHKLAAIARARRAALRRSGEIQTIALASAMSLAPRLSRSRLGLAALVGPVLVLGGYALFRRRWPTARPSRRKRRSS